MQLPNVNTRLLSELKPREYEYLRKEVEKFTQETVDIMVGFQKNAERKPPFLGVIVLYRNGREQLKHLKTYLNTELELNLESNIRDLRNAILERSDELQAECSIFSLPKLTQTKLNMSNITGYEIQSNDIPSFVVKQMYFGTPAGIKNGFAIPNYPGDIHGDIPYRLNTDNKISFSINDYNINDNETLQNIYKYYIRSVKTQIEYGKIEVKDKGEIKTYNYDSLNAVLKNSPNPIAWMIVEIGCEYINNNRLSNISTIRGTFRNNYSGPSDPSGRGKTRRNKLRQNKLRRKRNKSQKRRNRL